MSEFDFQLDRQKYLQIARAHGAGAALTALQLDTENWEKQTFEGDQGWNPALWRKLEEVRKFSRELWDESTLGANFSANG